MAAVSVIRWLLFACLLHAAPGAAQAPAPEADTTAEELGQMMTELSGITGLKATRPVAFDVMTRQQLRRFLDQRVKELVDPADLRAEELTLKKFGLVPPDFNLLQTTLDVMTEQAVAFYDDRQKKMVLLEGATGMMRQVALVHELAHALADQHFDLGKFLRMQTRSDDALTARQAVAEGQAMWLMAEYTAQRMGQSIRDTPQLFEMMSRASEMTAGQFPSFDKAPLYIRESLLFPYARGMTFQQAVLAKQGPAGFTEVFRKPPVSTQQILHPERYLAGTAPTSPKLPSFANSRDYKVLAEGTFGEFDHLILLRQHAPGPDVEALAGAWRGGKYRLHEQKGGSRIVLAYASEWATAADAERFLREYLRVLRGKWRTPEVPDEASGHVTGRGDDGHFAVRLDGNRVTVLEGLEKADVH